jgi:hypothetical protein
MAEAFDGRRAKPLGISLQDVKEIAGLRNTLLAVPVSCEEVNGVAFGLLEPCS